MQKCSYSLGQNAVHTLNGRLCPGQLFRKKPLIPPYYLEKLTGKPQISIHNQISNYTVCCEACPVAEPPSLRVAERLCELLVYCINKQQIRFNTEHCRKYPFYKKKIQIKIVQNSISYKKFSRRICLSLPEVDVGTPKIVIFEILKWESKFTLELNAAKNTNYIKKSFK